MSEQRDKNKEIKMLERERDKINLSDYPLDSFLIRSDHRSIWQVMQRIKSKRYLLERDFPQDDCRQRLLWDARLRWMIRSNKANWLSLF